MPKINSGGAPSYDGAGDEVGVVTSATGEQFDLSGQSVDEERDQQQDEGDTGTGAKAPAKTGSPSVKQTSTTKK